MNGDSPDYSEGGSFQIFIWRQAPCQTTQITVFDKQFPSLILTMLVAIAGAWLLPNTSKNTAVIESTSFNRMCLLLTNCESYPRTANTFELHPVKAGCSRRH